MKTRSVLKLLFVALIAFASGAFAAFDPVNDDTDIFLANPNIVANRPNVLIVLDNTANWNNAFTNEKNALVQVINGLSDAFNVGLMMFPETGGSNDSIDGGYVRFHVRQMTNQNKTALASLVNNLNKIADKGNNATTGLALHEAYLYYAGKTSIASHGKVKTDKDGTTDPILSPLTGHALPAGNMPGLYRSPIADDCQRSFIIYISNGPAAENATARAQLEGYLASLTGQSPPATIGISPSGQQGNWADEMSKFMANADVNTNQAGVQNVYTYVIEVDPGLTGQGPDMTALMRSTATNGKGKYFAVNSTASGTAIVDALNAIFTEVQAVNSVFASTTLPVSVNVRGTNLNQVYIGVFRPDPNKAPRWLGNLKMYNLALDTATSKVFLADASNGPPPAVGNPAENSTTGFIAGSASSFWTTNSNYWAFRDPSQNGVGGASDAPDGDLVEKGGAAQRIRQLFPLAEGTTPKRRLYTCTNGGTFASQCTPGSLLSATPFADNNTDIDAGSLQLATRFVSPLTAFDTKAVTSLIDRREAILSNAASPVSVTSLSNGATTRTLTSLSTSTPKIVTTLTAAVSGTITVSLASIVKEGGSYRVSINQPLSGVVAGTVLEIACTSGNTGDFNTLNAAQRTVSTVTSTQSFLIPGPSGGNKTCNGGSVNGPGTTNSTTATATVSAHGFTSGQSVTITGATPVQFNGTFNITLIDSDNFRYTISAAAGAASPNPTITAAGNTSTATATTSAAHGFLAGTGVTITGASNPAYNGTKIVLANPAPTATTFSYSVTGTPGPNTASPVYAHQGGSTLVTANAPGHSFVNGASVTISGSDIGGYNGTFVISGVTAGVSFQFPTATVQPANNSSSVTASVGTVSIVTATVSNHGFNPGNPVVIESTGGDAVHPGTYTVATVPNANTFTYSTGVALAPPAGTYTARPPTLSSRAIATVAAHGLTAGAEVTIAGATPTDYNGIHTVARVVDANTFEYTLPSAPGTNTGSGVTASIKTTTARATSVAHGFSTGNTVVVAGATPTAFNGSHTITVLDPSTFTYTIGSPQGDATGTVTAVTSGASSAERTALINWVRGEDNFQDENSNTSKTDIRASVHGDVLHSRPAVINFNRFGSDNDVYVFYGANDGIFHAIKGGYATDAGDPSGLAPGQEAWGFVASEFFPQLNRLRTNSPTISSSFKKPYFMDGPIGIYTRDNDGNGKLGDAGDAVNLFIATRRGGRFMYALDVNVPTAPRLLWKITNGTAGFSELGQTWSEPKVVNGLAGLATPVLIFGAGYDPAVEDIPPTDITSASTTSVTTAAGTFNRTMGRGLFVVNALTGARVWSAGATGSGATLEVAGMSCAIASDVTVIKNESGGPTNRAYVGDTCGNVWRFDFSGANLSTTTVTKIAAVGDLSTPSGRRKFLHAPDVVGQQGFDAVLIGSGDREHPFDTTVINRMYMFKDTGPDTGPVTGTGGGNPTLTEGALTDVTSNCLQDIAGCPAGVTQTDFAAQLAASNGWYLTLGAGEKVIGNVVSLSGTTFFNTNQPSASAGGGTCGSNLGIARQYQVSTVDATATTDLNAVGGLTGADRSLIHAGGGYLPSPVHVVVILNGKPVEAVISGIQVSQPAGASLSARLRRYWYREVDQ